MFQLTIMLTDGWYGIKAVVDRPLSAIIQRGRLGVGDKILGNWSRAAGRTGWMCSTRGKVK